MEGSLAGHLPLARTATALRNGAEPLIPFLDRLCDRLDTVEPHVAAFLPEPGRRERLLGEAAELEARFPDPQDRPPLYGVPVGVKDLFRTDGFETRCGSALPPECFTGEEAPVVTAVKKAGALILGKTVTTEFAYFQPGPTRNPHNTDHTPGGSSSGSAAAVAAGLAPLAFGTQTIGSITRPAAYCGVLGFKPSYDRISSDGVISFSQAADHIGFFTVDMEGIILAASLLVRDWQPQDGQEGTVTLGVPDAAYLNQAVPEALSAFRRQLARLEEAGYTVKQVDVLRDIQYINETHTRMIAGEIARVHEDWFSSHEALYSSRTAALIREGQDIDEVTLDFLRANRTTFREELETAMGKAGIDLYISPAATGTAPVGIGATGSPLMNLPWTHAGLPTLGFPAGTGTNGLPLGLQIAAPFMADERLLALGTRLSGLFSGRE